jgi:hypothetical protein
MSQNRPSQMNLTTDWPEGAKDLTAGDESWYAQSTKYVDE